MHYLLLKGLRVNSTPGDVLGAVVNQTTLSGEDIGTITIDALDEEAIAKLEVEPPSTTYDVRQIEEVGGAQVRAVTWKKEAFTKLNNHIQQLKQLVEAERNEEMKRHENEIAQLSGYEREQRGRTVLHLSGKEVGQDLGGKEMIKFTRKKPGEQLPETEISVGDLAMFSKNDPLRDDNPTGTIAEKTKYSFTVAFENTPPSFVFDRGVRLDLYVNDITYQRMLSALNKLPFHSSPKLVNAIIGTADIPEVKPKELSQTPSLNTSQQTAAGRALQTDTFFCIHGPPGTGKTTTLVETIVQLQQQSDCILATAPSNVAVDNLVEFLLDRPLEVVRVGHPARITPSLRQTSLDYKVQEKPAYQKSQQLRDQAEELQQEQESHQIPSGRYRRGLSDGQIHQLARKGSSARGVGPETIQEMSNWLQLQDKIDRLYEEIQSLEDQAIEQVLEEATVVCTTNSSAGSDLLADKQFDWCVIDEATQATEPSCLIPLNKARKGVLAGDHKQLPPTVLNQSAQKELQQTLFERLVKREGSAISKTLTTQYRMHEIIMNFSNEEFYDEQLIADDSVRYHDLDGLDYRAPLNKPQWIRSALDPSEPFVFIDTLDMEAPERQREGSPSRENSTEAELVSQLVSPFLEQLSAEQLGVISPYNDQVDLINSYFDSEELEIKTVDGFQGREKEVIILSLVRSNPDGELGFLTDLRRLNVSITRARRKLVLVGDSHTITQHPTYRRLIDYVQDRGLYQKL